LDREDVTITDAGIKLKIRRSKADQEGKGEDVLISAGARPATCPVRAMRGWMTVKALNGCAHIGERCRRSGRCGSSLRNPPPSDRSKRSWFWNSGRPTGRPGRQLRRFAMNGRR
jgi:hypothetical protein